MNSTSGISEGRFYRLTGSGNGDVSFSNQNIDLFVEGVRERTRQLGVHIAIADGSDSSTLLDAPKFCESTNDGEHLINSVLASEANLRGRIVLFAESVACLRTLRVGGCFVLRVFNGLASWSGSADLVYLLSQLFRTSHLTKPLSSHPTSTERCELYIL